MLVFVGDVHGEIELLNAVLAKVPSDVPVIQVGDFGFWPQVRQHMTEQALEVCRPIYVIDGNHEYDPWLASLTMPTEVWPNVTFVPRGTVLELDGKRVGCLGGGESIDRAWRIEGVSWFPGERVTYAQARRLLEASRAEDSSADCGRLDVLVTHVPPGTIKQHVFGHPANSSEKLVEEVWKIFGKPPLVCGHMHPEQVVQVGTVTILPILGCWGLP
jgi:hypothetical protein